MGFFLQNERDALKVVVENLSDTQNEPHTEKMKDKVHLELGYKA